MVSQVIIDRHLYHINATTQEGLKWWLYTKEKLAVPGSDSSPFDEKLFAAMDNGTFWLNLVPSSLLLVIFNRPESFWLLLATRRRTLVLNSTSPGQETSKKVPYTITQGLKWLTIDAIRILISHYPICNVLTDLNSQGRCIFYNM